MEKVVRRHVRRGNDHGPRPRRAARPPGRPQAATPPPSPPTCSRSGPRARTPARPSSPARCWPACWPCPASPRSPALRHAARGRVAGRREDARSGAPARWTRCGARRGGRWARNCSPITARLRRARRAPRACTRGHRRLPARLLERVRQAVGDAGVAIQPDHLIREVALFADRTDVSEEVTPAGATWSSSPIWSARARRPGGSWSSSFRRWAARRTRSARRPATWPFRGTCSRSRRRSKRSANWCRTWSSHWSLVIRHSTKTV